MDKAIKGQATIAIRVGVTGIKDVKIKNVTMDEALKEATNLINCDEVVTLAHHYGLYCGKALYNAVVYFHNGTDRYAVAEIVNRTNKTF